MKAWMIWMMYAIATAILAVIGYFIGRGRGKELCFALTGMTIGLVLSIILWFTVGEKMAK